jgi:anti-sigma factor RsiW
MNQPHVQEQKASCPHRDRVRAYCAGTLSETDSADLESHIIDCPQCGELIDAWPELSDATIQALSSLPSTVDDEPEFQRLESQLLSAMSAAVSATWRIRR